MEYENNRVAGVIARPGAAVTVVPTRARGADRRSAPGRR